ncbi:MAG: Glucose-1-phosphate thymidylyltransferase [Verrucomicrobiae bacterium]|nr:Glucose-1-phosphate thymidylyltransferase [Verrucomicrobiae bacterium]
MSLIGILKSHKTKPMMKGVILAGGLGTRLYPLTKITNKHLLPVFDRPMIFYPIQTLAGAGILDLLIVTGGNNAADFQRLLGNGKSFGLRRLTFAYQRGEGGIADALRLAEKFAAGENIAVMLGDNLVEKNIRSALTGFRHGARIFLKAVANPRDYGVPQLKSRKIIRIIEKPKRPPSRYAVIGLYLYDNQVFDIIRTLKPSARGELEITDVNNAYLQRGELQHRIISGWWADAGASPRHLLAAGQRVARQ